MSNGPFPEPACAGSITGTYFAIHTRRGLPMFKKKSPGVSQAKLTTLIAHDVQIAGNLEFSNGLRMDGHVKEG
ncbi:MAG: Integral membrane protein CcmA involved in cell shape determination [uncultured Caballeronia sp.]|nr:MAG: Integral membrane protein CcmA involved in cell shape determination [uncultured Caballeronia sp.]